MSIVRDDAHAALAALFHSPAGRGDWTHTCHMHFSDPAPHSVESMIFGLNRNHRRRMGHLYSLPCAIVTVCLVINSLIPP